MIAFDPSPTNVYQMPGASIAATHKGSPVSGSAPIVVPAIDEPHGRLIAMLQKSPGIGTSVVKLSEGQLVISPPLQYGVILTNSVVAYGNELG